MLKTRGSNAARTRGEMQRLVHHSAGGYQTHSCAGASCDGEVAVAGQIPPPVGEGGGRNKNEVRLPVVGHPFPNIVSVVVGHKQIAHEDVPSEELVRRDLHVELGG